MPSSMIITCLSTMFLVLVCIHAASGHKFSKAFDVNSYGAIPDGKTDNTKAFLLAWKDVCQWKGNSGLYVPRGVYMVGSVIFSGPCEGSVYFILKGALKATTNPSEFFIDHWITFKYVDRLVVKGGGFLYGEGSSAWRYNDCRTNSGCKPLPATMRFDFVKNSRINNIHSIDSKNVHFNLFACDNVNISYVTIKAPAESPNTDGIRIGASSNIMIKNSNIGTGDDCISIIAGSRNILASGVSCGPGHGFSVGSLGGSPNEGHVEGVTIRKSSLRGTQNGLRIKTWAPSQPTTASHFVFEDVTMENVHNPIFIDQQYCPRPSCNRMAQSRVQISNVTFRNINGTSMSKEAVKLQCSGLAPCHDVRLVDIDLVYKGPKGPASSSCFNVKGKSYGHQSPSGCL